MKKRAQVAGFIIIGLLLVIAGFAFYFARTSFLAPGIEPSDILDIPHDEAAFRDYVQQCMAQSVKQIIPNISKNAGKLVLEDNFHWYEQEKYRIYCSHVEGLKSCQNSFITRQDIEAEFEAVLPALIESCFDFDAFRKQGIEVTPGNMTFDVKIGVDDITAELDFPVLLKIKDQTLKVNNYIATVPSNLGYLYDLAVAIVNSEIELHTFNKDSWMTQNNVFVNIEKHKPYPHIVYRLSKNDPVIQEDIEFLFSVEGEDKSVTIGSTPSFREIGKDCLNTYDRRCFKNVDSSLCTENSGQVTRCSSPIPVSSVPDCNGHECRSCIRDDKEIPHGSSWCVYDSIQNQRLYGLSYVGSRHYKQSCIDGTIITEECRDFREELCTQDTSGQLSQAVCRINRWEDCAFCPTESCCEDETKRDCQWDDRLFLYLDGSRVDLENPERKCFPIVPPGFRFWEGYGQDVCNMGTQYAYCKGWGACPGSYVDDSALYCLRLGDCGNFRNIADEITHTGFFNTDPTDKVDSYVMLVPGLNKDPSSLGLDPIDVSLATVNQELLVSEYPSTLESLPLIMQQAVSYIQYAQSISPNPIVLMNLDPNILEYSFCSLWVPPEGASDCQLCEADPDKPCSEYRCHSLGRNCLFESVEGVPSCTPMDQDDLDPPKIFFDVSSLQKGFVVQPAEISPSGRTMSGFKITPAVKPYFPFSLGIETDEPARCKLTFLPMFDYYSIPAIWFGDPKFAESHEIMLRFPKEFSIPSKVYQYLDIQSLEEIVDIVEDLENRYEEYKDKYSVEIQIVESVRGVDVIKTSDKIVDLVVRTIDPVLDLFPYLKDLARILFSKIEDNTYMLFVKCIDESGNQNQEAFFIEFQIDPDAQDTYPVEYLGSSPENNSLFPSDLESFELKFYINEPAECHYDFVDRNYEDMSYGLQCPLNSLNMSAISHGSYECRAMIPFDKDNVNIFVRCLDNPEPGDHYTIRLKKVANATNAEFPPYFEINGSEIEVDADLLNDFEIETSESNIVLSIYIDEDMTCSLTPSDTQQKFPFTCASSYNPNIGLYRCTSSFPIANNMTASIFCESDDPLPRNVNPESFHLNFTRSKELLDLLEISSTNIRVGSDTYTPDDIIPSSSPIIGIVFDISISEHDIVCGYSRNPNLPFAAMFKYNDFVYEAQLSGLSNGEHIFNIECHDNIGNSMVRELRFTVET